MKRAAREMGQKAKREKYVKQWSEYSCYCPRKTCATTYMTNCDTTCAFAHLRLREIGMSEHDHEMYQTMQKRVQRQIQTLRVMLANIQVCLLYTHSYHLCIHDSHGVPRESG